MVKPPTTLSSDCTCWLSGERSLPLGYLFNFEYHTFAVIMKSKKKYYFTKLFLGGNNHEEIWKEHCKNTEVLTQYAEAMHKLATQHWNKIPGNGQL